MRSTYDRSGGNEGADASHFLFQISDTLSVPLDLEGSGLLVFSRYNHWHGSPWHYIVDGTDHIVEETGAPGSAHATLDSVFHPPQAFPSPLNWTWATTKGADLVATPIPFERSFRLAYTRTHYGTGYYIYNLFVPGIPLSQPLRSWDESPPPADVLDLISRSGSDNSPSAGCRMVSGKLDLPGRRWTTAAEVSGRAIVRALEFSIPRAKAADFAGTRLRITWDGRPEPSVDVPIALFFGAGTLYNRDNREYLVKSFPVTIRFSNDRIYMACYFPMPFFKSARVDLWAGDREITGITWKMRYMKTEEATNELSYFHATYQDFPHPALGEDLLLLDTRKVEGGGDWSGQLVGTSFIFSHDANLRTLEGDPRFFFDDSLTPQVQGTGTEEWGGGGDYWGGLNMSLPFVGHPVGAASPEAAKDPEDKIESAYRFLLADLMPFGRNAVIRLEHGGENESNEHYETVTYWYGLPGASLVKTDELQIGNSTSEVEHHYFSPQASAPYPITSRYEWGVDTLGGKVVYPPATTVGRITKSTSEFRVLLRRDNLGVLLRRTLDYSYPNQRAEVYIASDSKTDWAPAGIWYLAGSNVCVYSNPKEELGETQHIVEVSNRRFRDDEFLISRELTQGRRSIWVRLRFAPMNQPLYPGYPLGEQAWSEIKYAVYSFVKPSK